MAGMRKIPKLPKSTGWSPLDFAIRRERDDEMAYWRPCLPCEGEKCIRCKGEGMYRVDEKSEINWGRHLPRRERR